MEESLLMVSYKRSDTSEKINNNHPISTNADIVHTADNTGTEEERPEVPCAICSVGSGCYLVCGGNGYNLKL